MKNRYSLFAFIISCLFIFGVACSYPRWSKTGAQATVSYDVSGYYLYLPALFIHQDLDELKFFPTVLETYRPSPHFDQAYEHPINGNYVLKYSTGMAVLYLPSFLVGHLAAWIGDYPMDGYATPYQATLYLGSILIAFLGLWFCRKNLLVFFEDRIVALVLILIAIGTNYLNYATIDAAMPHNYLFTLYALLIYFTIHWYEKPRWKSSIGIGVCIGLAALARPTEIIAVFIPLLWGVHHLQGLKDRLTLWQKHFPKLLLTGIIIASIGAIQLFYWKIYAGQWLEYSYQDQGFSWFNPHFSDVFFSYRKGWLIYTPLMLFPILGFYFLFKNYRSIFWATFVFFLLNTWIVCAWDIWWYGGGFGQRAMIQSYALLAFPLAAFIQFARTKPWRKWVIFSLFSIGVLLNLFQTWQAHWGGLDTVYMTKAYYWRIFANTNVTATDKFLMDTKEDFRGERTQVDVLHTEDFENYPEAEKLDSTTTHSGQMSTFVNAQLPFSATIRLSKTDNMNPEKWMRVGAWFFSYQHEWDVWRMPQLVIRFKQEGKIIKNRFIRPFRVLQQGQWQFISTDMKIPEASFDQIEIFMWSAEGTKKMYMDDLKVEIFEALKN